jgi:alkylation response protein AidB-like acyl-CoA dehydrogenase
MSPRLLSFLSEIEFALNADEPAPEGGAWQSTRTVNHGLGLARLYLATRFNPERLQPLGSVQLQSHRLADGSVCLKAFLSWTGRTTEAVHAIYDQPRIDWAAEARRVAAVWLSGKAQAECLPEALAS